jgi:hypothetical protein
MSFVITVSGGEKTKTAVSYLGATENENIQLDKETK